MFVRQLITSVRICANEALRTAGLVASPKSEAPTPPSRPLPVIVRTVESTLSPAYHNGHGWPAYAIEMLPPLSQFNPKDIQIFERVEATYRADGLPDLTLTEDLQNGDDIEIESVGEDPEDERHRCKAVFAIKDSVLSRARHGLTPAYPHVPRYITVTLRIAVTGAAS